MATPQSQVVVLAGGTGGARLARGIQDIVGSGLTVVANTGDDIEIHRAHVSPDPDLISYGLADRIDERGWGLAGDTFHAMDELRALGEDVWFRLGDRDLAVCLRRAGRLAEGARLTEALAELGAALDFPARVLPMSDHPVRTRVRARGRWVPFQEFMIRERAAGPVEGVDFAGARDARPAPEVLEAIAAADAIVIGPSNPIVTIGPILAVPGIREALAGARAPVVAVSPIVGGRVLKGPTAEFLAWAGVPCDATGVATLYEGLIDGILADEPVPGVRVHLTDVAMPDAAGRRRLGHEVVTFAVSLGE